MIKQRYIRHEAINKDGIVVGTGYEIGGSIYGFFDKCQPQHLGTDSTAHFMQRFAAIDDWKGWVEFHKRYSDTCKFTKAVVFVG